MQLRAASYERVSTDEQSREGFSLEVQNEKNVGYIRSQIGWEFIDSYIDPGKSAKDLKRPGIKRLIGDIKLGLINIVVVHKLDRLTRNIGDLHDTLRLFDKHKVKLVSISENIDTDSAMGRMFVYMLGIFAQWYRENLSEEVYKGQVKRAEKGMRSTGTAPYGYKVLPDLSLEINESEASVVKKIFDWFINGHSKMNIAKLLNSVGIDGNPVPSPKRKGIWRDSVIGTILKNPTYIGATHYKKKLDPEDKRIIKTDMHEQIISNEVFYKAISYAARKKEKSMSQSGHEFPFSTILKCAECGRSRNGRRQMDKGKEYRYYVCSGKKYNECTASVVPERALNALLLEFLSKFQYESPADLSKKIGERNVEKEIRRLKKMIEDSTTKRKNYTRAMGSGKLDYTLFEQLMDEENLKSAEWEKEYSQLQQIVPSTSRTRADLLQSLQDIRENWEALSFVQRKIMVQGLFSALVVKKIDEEEWQIVGYKFAE